MPPTTTSPNASDVRAWARSIGMTVSDRGPLPASLKAAYLEANPTSGSASAPAKTTPAKAPAKTTAKRTPAKAGPKATPAPMAPLVTETAAPAEAIDGDDAGTTVKAIKAIKVSKATKAPPVKASKPTKASKLVNAPKPEAAPKPAASVPAPAQPVEEFDEIDEILDRLEVVEDKLADLTGKLDAMTAASTQTRESAPVSAAEPKRGLFRRK